MSQEVAPRLRMETLRTARDWVWEGRTAAWWVVAVTTLAAFVLRVAGLNLRSVWMDEAYALHWAQYPLQQIPAVLLDRETHPPLFYFLLHFWAPFTDNDVIFRLPSAVIGALVIPVVYEIGRRIAGVQVGVISAMLIALMPIQVWFSQEARPYSFLTLLIACALLTLLQMQKHPTIWNAAAYGIFVALALYTHYGAIFCFVGLSLGAAVMAVRPGGQPWRRYWVIGSVLAVALFTPWVIAVVAHERANLSTSYTNSYIAAAPGIRTLRYDLYRIVASGFPLQYLPGGRVRIDVILAGILVVCTFGLARLSPNGRIMLVGWFGGTLVSGLIVAQRYPTFFQAKVFIPVSIVIVILLSSGIIWLYEHRPLLAAPALAFVAIVFVGGLWSMYTKGRADFVSEDWRSISNYVTKNIGQNDELLVIPDYNTFPLIRYLEKSDTGKSVRITTLPYEQREWFEREDIVNYPQERQFLDQLLTDNSQVWLLISTNSIPGQRSPKSVLKYYTANANLQGKVIIDGFTVYRYTRADSSNGGDRPTDPCEENLPCDLPTSRRATGVVTARKL